MNARFRKGKVYQFTILRGGFYIDESPLVYSHAYRVNVDGQKTTMYRFLYPGREDVGQRVTSSAIKRNLVSYKQIFKRKQS